MATKILFILTSHASLGTTGKPTGVWFEELATPYWEFVDAGAEVDLASILGGDVPVDPRSVGEPGHNATPVDRFLADGTAMAALRATAPIASVSADAYDAVFLPGGHGTMWDLPESQALAALLSLAWAKDKVVSAVCHGPAGLLNATAEGERPLVKGRRVAAFTDAEEAAVGLTETVPFLLETRLRALGAEVVAAANFQPNAVRDGNLITGQNPASCNLVAQLVLQALADGPHPR